MVSESVAPAHTCTVSDVSSAVGEGSTATVACPEAVPGHPPLSVILTSETVDVEDKLNDSNYGLVLILFTGGWAIPLIAYTNPYAGTPFWKLTENCAGVAEHIVSFPIRLRVATAAPLDTST